MHHACTLSYRQAKQPGALMYEQRHTARSRGERERKDGGEPAERRFHGQAHEAAARSICKQADAVSGLQITVAGRQNGGGRTGRPVTRKGSLYGATIYNTHRRGPDGLCSARISFEKGSGNACRIKTHTHAHTHSDRRLRQRKRAFHWSLQNSPRAYATAGRSHKVHSEGI